MSNKRTFSAMQGDGKEQEWSYWNKTILAPMVRVGTLPFRRLATSYGADIVYSEEIIDKRIMKCTRVEDKKTGLVSFRYVEPRTTKTKKPLPVQNTFITFPGENVVFQMGTSNAENALKAARIVEHDVRAIDVNMGCPKHFSVHAGMGCALLINPDNVRSILSTLVENLSIPVTCKIRLLDSVEETVALCKVALECKVAALAIHGRRPVDRPRHKAMPELVKEVFSRLREESELARNTPLIYNGDVTYNHQMAEFKERSGADAVMVARGAMWNASVFNPTKMASLREVCLAYVAEAEQVDNRFANTKFVLQQMLQSHIGSAPGYKKLIMSKDYAMLRTALHGDEQTGEGGVLSLAAVTGPYAVAAKHKFVEPRPVVQQPTKEYLEEYIASGGKKNKKTKKNWKLVEKRMKKREKNAERVVAQEKGKVVEEEEKTEDGGASASM
jgi:tRNA-dihydrouridine synthase 2